MKKNRRFEKYRLSSFLKTDAKILNISVIHWIQQY